jgi:hypothetical protein
VGSGDLSQVEAGEYGVPELEEPEPEPVAAARGDVLDEARARQGREQARDRARVDPGPACDLVRPELSLAVGERVEDGEGTLDCGDVPNGWLPGPARATLRSVFETPLPRRQF